MAKLSSKERNSLPDSAFAGPGRSYPVHDKGHAAFAIKVASIQRDKGNLSPAQYAAIHAKASRVLHMKDGGAVREEPIMKRAKKGVVTSNMGKQFAKKAAMRLADGGVVDPGYPRATAEQIGRTAGFPTSSATPAYGYQPSAAPLPNAGPPRMDMTNSMQGPRTDWSAAWDSMKRGWMPDLSKTTTTIGVRGKDGGATADIERRGLRAALRHGELHYGEGKVKGPGGPREDKVPAMLSDGEYVLPADVVDHVGKDNLDAFVASHHQYSEKVPSLRDGGVSHYADGGVIQQIKPNFELPGGPSVNPRVDPAYGSPEARAFLGEPPPSPSPVSGTPAAAAVEAAPKGALYRAGRFAGGAGRMAARIPGLAAPFAIAAPLAGFEDYKINDPEVDSSAGETFRLMGNRVKDLFNGTALPEDRAAGQANLRKGLVEAGLDSASGLAKTADWAAGILGAHPDFSGRLQRGVQADLGSSVTTPQYTPPAPSQPAPQPQQEAANDGASDGSLRTVRDGNNVSITGDQPTYRRNIFSPEERASLRRAQYAPTQYGPSIGDSNDEAFARLRSAAAAPPEGSFSADIMARRGARVAAQERDLAQRERESLRSAGVSLTGQQMTAATARNAARLDQMNKDRQFRFETAKAFGTDGSGTGGEVGRAEQKARIEAQQATHERITTMIPPVTGPDGKSVPDVATAARYTTGLNALLGQKIKATEAYLQQNPGDAKATAWLRLAHSEGTGALGDDDVRKFVSGMQAADVAQENHSLINPIAGRAVTSDAPITSLRRKPGIIFDDYVSDRGDVIPARHIDKRGFHAGFRWST
jgi:hypothetical protein